MSKKDFDLKRGVIERDHVFVERGSLEKGFRVRNCKWEKSVLGVNFEFYLSIKRGVFI